MKQKSQNAYRVVLDTNVFISGASLSPTPPSEILDLWRENRFTLVTSPDILIEVEEVLLRPHILKFTKFSPHDVFRFVNEITQRAYITEGIYEVKKITIDPDDNTILACALEGKATHIVTGDKESLLPLKQYQKIDIVTPKAFLELLHI